MLVESTVIKAKAFVAMFEPFGADVLAKAMAHHRANEGISRLKKIRYCYRQFLDRDLTDDALDEIGRGYTAIVEDAVVACPWVPGAKEFLETNGGRLALFVASGTPEAELRRITARRHMDRYFAAVHGSPAGKADIVRHCVAAHDLRPEHCLFVGDALSDHEGARRSGARFIGRVPPGRPSLFPEGTAVIADLFALSI